MTEPRNSILPSSNKADAGTGIDPSHSPEPLAHLVRGTRADSAVPYLDGLRGLAALSVVIGHYSIFHPAGVLGPAISAIASYGVILFFVLSAFLLTGILVKSLEQRPFSTELAVYFKRRFLRIYPLFIVVLLLLELVPSFRAMMYGGRDLALYKQLFLIYPEGNFWAIGVEFEFYFILPLFPLMFSRTRSTGSRLLVVALLLILIPLQWWWNLTRGATPPITRTFRRTSTYFCLAWPSHSRKFLPTAMRCLG